MVARFPDTEEVAGSNPVSPTNVSRPRAWLQRRKGILKTVSDSKDYDLILIGGGIMSATLAVLLKQVRPQIKMLVIERLDDVALESSNAWNNAGTGHAALCELNYMPDDPNGGVPSPSKAISINQQFQESREFWAYLVKNGILNAPETFIHSIPHMTFVRGEKDSDYLRRRFESLKTQPLFSGIEFTEDPRQIASWSPLLIEGRKSEKIAATRIEQGTDVDYGAITRQLFIWLGKNQVGIAKGTEVKKLRRIKSGGWSLQVESSEGSQIVTSEKVFVGAGGWALKLLQGSGIPEIRGYGTFPVSGHFLKTTNPALVGRHEAKVYSQAAVGAPPMSVPHLDTRVIDGKRSLLFGPFAGLNPKFLKNGSVFDLPKSLRLGNIFPYLSVALRNLGLVKYLITEVSKSESKKFESLKEFVPNAVSEDWELYEAGQRAQVIKPNGLGGVLQFGTELISSKDGSIAGLLGASPGASVAVRVMLEVIEKLYQEDFDSSLESIHGLVPSFGTSLNDDPKKAQESLSYTAKTLKLKA